MKNYLRLLFLICFLYLVHCVLLAQTNGYQCDFEDTTEIRNWTLNAGPFGGWCTNKWYIGSAESNGGGVNAMYISYDEGKTAGYLSGVGNGQVVSAYRLISHLPADNYEISFDWQALGIDGDALYVCWVPETEFSNSTNQSDALPKYVTDYGIRVGGRSALNNSLWNSSYGSFRHDGTPHKLCFVWKNGVNGSVSPAGCVDNIMIIPLSSCKKPTGITLTARDTVLDISWTGQADSYDIKVKSRETNEWKYYNGIVSNSVSVESMPEGVIEVYIRSNCGEFYSVWVSRVQFIYYPGLRCVDFLDINEKNCFYGTAHNPSAEDGKVDFGFESSNSRHTIHYNRYETDPRTSNGLSTVSPYDIASVRLGNWMINTEGEMIEYDFYVEPNEAEILLLHYAVVLQLPNHDEADQPHFTLEVADTKGHRLSDCTFANFSAGFGTGASEGWIQVGDGPDAVVWKDWSTVGVNLDDYSGQNLKIRLTTRDCTGGAHYGYAYFAVSCASGRLESLSCGASKKNVFSAPEGFNYHWFKLSDPTETLVSDKRELSLEQSDTTTYCCKVKQIMNDSCYFTLTAVALPRFPVAEATYEAEIRDCQNVVKFSDSSHVIFLRGDESILSKDDYCDSIQWNFGDGTPISTEWSPEHIFPYEGGEFTVTQRVFLAGDCDSVSVYNVSLPEIKIPRDTTYAVVCDGESYSFNGNDYYITGQYNDTIVGGSLDGCDSITMLDLYVVEHYNIESVDTICSDNLPFVFNGKEYYDAGLHIETFRSYYGCDSTVSLMLTINESLNIDFPNVIDVCADAGVALVPYCVTSGVVSSFDIKFDSDAMEDIVDVTPNDATFDIPISDEVVPGFYRMKITFANMDCGDVELEATLLVYYPDSILVQRWNDVLAVRNSIYNGGYDFINFQWFKDDEPIEGAINSILYQPNGLDTGALYHVNLTRLDGVTINSCPIQPILFSDISVSPTVTFVGSEVKVKSPSYGEAKIFNTVGVHISTVSLHQGETQMRVPAVAGTYIVRVELADGTTKTEKIIVKSVE